MTLENIVGAGMQVMSSISNLIQTAGTTLNPGSPAIGIALVMLILFLLWKFR